MEAVPLTFESREGDTLALAGDADETQVPDLRERLDDLVTRCASATLDLSGIGFLPSAAIGVVVRARAAAKARGAALRIVAADGSRAAQVLTMTGVRFDTT